MAVELLMDNHSPTGAEVVFPEADRLIHALRCFFHRSWFSRVWVIQEVLLAGDAVAYCSRNTLPFAAIQTFYQWNTTEKWLAKLPYVVFRGRKGRRHGLWGGCTNSSY
ncbi:hypothetical protein N657DRAFT_681081 [Parathielavia appendiculata]|uniref:Heterokaryon incompatibility domain-containing protein n=1 Tax=Parathielavia appendiculata TaxID=2587402 RepID=A0AAN6U2D7_9PEZI|nr:hypothetical protein N657DRAFT_681081 [Parathielavia appendiculata]